MPKISPMQKLTLFIFFVQIFILPVLGQSVPPIEDWSIKELPVYSLLCPNDQKNTILFYQVRKPGSTELAGGDWFNAAVATDIKKETWTETSKGQLSETDDVYFYVTEVSGPGNQSWYLLYLGHQFAGNRVRLARVQCTKDAAYFQTNGATASRHFGRLVVSDRANKNSATPKDEPPAPKTKPVITVKETKAGTKGISQAEVHAVIMHLEYQGGMGGGIYPVYNPYVLFKNGSIYKHPEQSLDEVDAKNSAASEPRKWGTWKNSGTGLVTYWPAEKPNEQNKTWKKESYYATLPARAGETLPGKFKSISGGGNTALGGDVMIAAYSYLVMNDKGQFILDKGAGISGSDIWETHSSKTNDAGSYRLNGYSIEMKFNDGKTEKRFFYFYPDSRRHFGLGGAVYMPAK
jgi:hypothetical protein